jgi:pyruvate formate lyase activating enzyme
MENKPEKNWRQESQLARYWHTAGEKVQCELCPRHCELKPGQKGFCLVRGNVGGQMHTFNYGVSVQATIECIETEAVNHYRPGARILSMGNIGCMMACSYCQNWQTSQVKFLNDKNVNYYTPQDVIDLALNNNIGVISWTYNDPVVWQEFVVDTSRLAQKHGIKTLYKSALYIEEAPLNELIEVIDIFSISLKGMDPVMYKKQTKGELEPVLQRIKQIGRSGKHLEISQLVVTELNDDGEDARKTAAWMVENVGSHVPFHLVAYHPAFKYNKPRTTIETLLKLRHIAMSQGIEYCYLGNVYADDVSNTDCKKCSSRLVHRFGLSVRVTGLDQDGCCTNCGEKSTIKEPTEARNIQADPVDFRVVQTHNFDWNREVNSIHVTVNELHTGTTLKLLRNPGDRIEYLKVSAGLERLIVSKSFAGETHISIMTDNEQPMEFLPVLDRAHFPVKNPSAVSDKYLN